MIEKCLGHAKPVIKQKSMECVMSMLASSENFDEDTLDAIEEFCKSKNAKVSKLFAYTYIYHAFSDLIFRFNKWALDCFPILYQDLV